MIIRKPYAFLIKNFKKIHIFLFVLAGYILFKVSTARSFVREVIMLGSYDSYNEPISKYLSFLLIIGLLLAMFLFLVIILLLRKKKKPWKLYLVPLLGYLATIIICFISRSIFSSYDGGSSVGIRSVSDLLLISILLQIPTFIILLIRILGVDLNKFNFKMDEEYLELDSNDLDEFELNIDIDKNSFKRSYKKLIRNTFYVYAEHKFIINIIISVLVVFILFSSYRYFFVLHKSYKQGDYINSSGYTIKINRAYYTDKNYSGNVISKSSSFLIIDLNIKNNVAMREVNFNRFHVMNGVNNYSYTFNTYGKEFSDIGKTLDKKELKNGEEVNLIMVYKVDKKLDKNKFVLYYQELDNKPYLRKIKIDVEDLSKIVDMKVKSIGEEEKFSLGKSTKSVTFDSVDIGDSFTYSVQDCTNFSGCYTTSEEIAVDSSSKILKISFISDDFQGKEFIDFSVKYGKISYIDDKGNVKSISVVDAINEKYKGNYLYIKVPLEVLNAKEINISYTIRNKRYVYKIK